MLPVGDLLLRVVPVQPAYVPPPHRVEVARRALELMLPSDTTSASVGRHVFFVDCGTQLQSVTCPLCDAQLTTPQWESVLEAASARQFTQLLAVVPCCTGRVMLTDLRFQEPCAFARFMLESRNPTRLELTRDEMTSLERMVASPLRVVVARV